MRIFSLFLVFLVPLLQACVTDTTQDITLSARTAALYRQYSEVAGEKVLAVTTDGKHAGYGFCRTLDCRGGARSVALQSCLESRNSARLSQADCAIFAVGDRIIWEGAVTIPDAEEPLRYRYNQAEGTRQLGPEAAEGVVLYVPGNHSLVDLATNDGIVPFYLHSMAAAGWDIQKAVTSNAEFAGEVHERAAAALNAKLLELRAMGYKRVVLAGQSFGAWLGVQAATDPGFAGDAVIAAVPASFGPAESPADGSHNPHFSRNSLEFLPMLQDVHGRLLLIFFEEDPYDPPGRAAAASVVLRESGATHLIIDRPAGFSGHSAAWLAAFDFAYGQCIEAFISASDSGTAAACERPDLDPADHRWMTRREHLAASPVRRATTAEMKSMLGNTVIGYLQTGDIATYYLFSADRTFGRIESGYLRSQNGGFSLATSYDGDMFCFTNREECYEIYRWSEDLVIAVTPAGDIAFRGQILPGNPRGIFDDGTRVRVMTDPSS